MDRAPRPRGHLRADRGHVHAVRAFRDPSRLAAADPGDRLVRCARGHPEKAVPAARARRGSPRHLSRARLGLRDRHAADRRAHRARAHFAARGRRARLHGRRSRLRARSPTRSPTPSATTRSSTPSSSLPWPASTRRSRSSYSRTHDGVHSPSVSADRSSSPSGGAVLFASTPARAFGPLRAHARAAASSPGRSTSPGTRHPGPGRGRRSPRRLAGDDGAPALGDLPGRR